MTNNQQHHLPQRLTIFHKTLLVLVLVLILMLVTLGFIFGLPYLPSSLGFSLGRPMVGFALDAKFGVTVLQSIGSFE